MSSCSGWCAVLVFLDSSFWSRHWLIWCNKGIKLPFYWQKGSLFIWVGVLCMRMGDTISSFLLTWRGTYPLHPPCLVLLTMTQFHEWLHWSWGSLSAGIYGQQCHSLCQIHVFLPMSTATSHYLRSSLDVYGRSHNFPLIHHREVLLAGHWVTTLPLLSCGIIVCSLPSEACLHGVGLVQPVLCWWIPIHKGTPTSDVTRSQF